MIDNIKALKRIILIDGFVNFTKKDRISHIVKVIHTLADFTDDQNILEAFEDVYDYDKLIHQMYGSPTSAEIKEMMFTDLSEILLVDGVVDNMIRANNYKSIGLKKDGVIAKVLNSFSASDFKKVFGKIVGHDFDYITGEMAVYIFLNNYIKNPVDKFYKLEIPNLLNDNDFYLKICNEIVEFDSEEADFFYKHLSKKDDQTKFNVLKQYIIKEIDNVVKKDNITNIPRILDASNVMDFKSYVKRIVNDEELFPMVMMYDIICKKGSSAMSPVICIRQELAKSVLSTNMSIKNKTSKGIGRDFISQMVYPLFYGHSFLVGSNNLDKDKELDSNLDVLSDVLNELSAEQRVKVFKGYVNFLIKSSKNKEFKNGFSLLYAAIGVLKIDVGMLGDEIKVGVKQLSSTLNYHDSVMFLSLYSKFKNKDPNINLIKDTIHGYVGSLSEKDKKTFLSAVVSNIVHITQSELSSLGTIISGNKLDFEELLVRQKEMLSIFGLTYNDLKINIDLKSKNNKNEDLFVKFRTLLESTMLKESSNITYKNNKTLKV